MCVCVCVCVQWHFDSDDIFFFFISELLAMAVQEIRILWHQAIRHFVVVATTNLRLLLSLRRASHLPSGWFKTVENNVESL